MTTILLVCSLLCAGSVAEPYSNAKASAILAVIFMALALVSFLVSATKGRRKRK